MKRSQVIATLKKIQAAPQKSLGQNFLIQNLALKKILHAASLKKTHNVLEIGPGLGILTQNLLKQAKKVIAIEKDSKYSRYLEQKFAPFIQTRRLILLNQDILKINLPQLINQHLIPKASSKDEADPQYKIVANIPYNISTRLIRLLLTDKPRAQDITLLVQKEIAQRVCAKPPRANPLSLFARLISQPQITARIDKSCFYPIPKVDSAVLSIKKINSRLDLGTAQNQNLLRLIKISFSSPRKTLVNNLCARPDLSKKNIQKILNIIDLPPLIRAQELTLKHWTLLNHKLLFPNS
ncbi:MAG: 16S rRNA (adenine(1518)-N(6)/adenine(1519)-N(6))-dimethyltransferase RsmA [Patescibacteria group bacterium]|nr:ribosomal RNA small subunit methyltransferase A [Patescibacteria group bacterium]